MGSLLVLAIAAAFYPTLLAVVLVIVTRPRPMRLFAAFLLGGMITSVSLGLVIVFALDGELRTGGHDSVTLGPAIDLVVGAAMLGVGIVTWRRRGLPPSPWRQQRAARRAAKRGERDPWTTRMMAHDSVGLTFVLGVVLNLPSVWYLIALKDITQADYPPVGDIVRILLFNVIMFALIEIPLACYVFSPDRSRDAVERFDAWMRRNARGLAAGAAVVAGVLLLVKGIVRLL